MLSRMLERAGDSITQLSFPLFPCHSTHVASLQLGREVPLALGAYLPEGEFVNLSFGGRKHEASRNAVFPLFFLLFFLLFLSPISASTMRRGLGSFSSL